MGENINLLSERQIGNKTDANTRLELHENIHWHYRNLRFVFKIKDFYNIATMFEYAKREFIKFGMPESSIEPKMLGETNLIDDGYHNNRLGCELTSDGTVHIHYRDLRIHLIKADFLIFAETLYQGLLTLSGLNTQIIQLDNSIIVPDVVKNKYLSLLKEYDEGKHEKVSADDVISYYMKFKYYERCGDKNIQRPKGLHGLSYSYPCNIPEEVERKYLFAMYESIKKYGYAKGPYLNEHIVSYKQNDKIYITGAHRIASLIYLGFKEITVILVEPEINNR